MAKLQLQLGIFIFLTIEIIDSERVQGEKKNEKDAFDELEASQVKEAALDDKLGIELKSIVQQIQVRVCLQIFSFVKVLGKTPVVNIRVKA